MTDEQIENGINLAWDALMFAIFVHGKARKQECRQAILTLFGPEVDAAVQKRMSQMRGKEE